MTPDPAKPDPPDVIVLHLVPLPDDVPPAIRLRQLLKRARRDWKLKCLSITTRAADPDDGGEDADKL